jgi:hypothetical protein
MHMHNTGVAKQLIKATSAKSFVTELMTHAKTLSGRSIAYLGLWNEGAVLDVTGVYDSLPTLKVGDQLEITMSPETRAVAPCLINSVHLVGDEIVVNAAENLFTYVQAEEIVRAIAGFMRETNMTSILFGGLPSGQGSWILPRTGAPICLSSFGLGWVLPYEGMLLSRDLVSGACVMLSLENVKAHKLARHNWTSFWSPSNEMYVVSMGHRVRDGYLYVTMRHGQKTIVEAWNLRALTKGGKVETKSVNLRPEWGFTWSSDLLGPVEAGHAIAVLSHDTHGIHFYGVDAPRA